MTTTKEASSLNLSQIGARGTGHAIGHHGELIQGVFEDEQGRLHRGLVTIPLDGLRSTAQLILNESANLSVVPREKTKALRGAHLTLEQLGRAKAGGLLRIESNIPVGHGYGSRRRTSLRRSGRPLRRWEQSFHQLPSAVWR